MKARGSRLPSFLPGARELDHLGPLVGFRLHEGAELVGAEHQRRGAQLGEPRLDLGIGEARIDLAVEETDDFDGGVTWHADAPPAAGLEPRYEIGDGRDIGEDV